MGGLEKIFSPISTVLFITGLISIFIGNNILLFIMILIYNAYFFMYLFKNKFKESMIISSIVSLWTFVVFGIFGIIVLGFIAIIGVVKGR